MFLVVFVCILAGSFNPFGMKSLPGMGFGLEVDAAPHLFIHLYFLYYSFLALSLICNNYYNDNNKIWGLGEGK